MEAGSVTHVSAKEHLGEHQCSRPRISAGSFAQLVSKFENLDTQSLHNQQRRSITTFRRGPIFSLTIQPDGNGYDDSNFRTTRFQTNGKDYKKGPEDPSDMVPHVLTPAKLPAQLRRSQSLKAVCRPLGIGSSHRSVAERRKVFESGEKGAAVTSPALATTVLSSFKSIDTLRSTDTRPIPQTPKIPIGESYPKPPTPPATPSNEDEKFRVLQLPRFLQDENVSAETVTPISSPERWPKDVGLDDIPTRRRHENMLPSSRRRGFVSTHTHGILHTSSHNLRGPYTIALAARSQPLIVQNFNDHLNGSEPQFSTSHRHQSWLENAQKMASSLSASISERDSPGDFQSWQYSKPFCQKPKKPHQLSNSEIDKAVSSFGSKISNLRRRFDLPKSSTGTTLPSAFSQRHHKTFATS